MGLLLIFVPWILDGMLGSIHADQSITALGAVSIVVGCGLLIFFKNPDQPVTNVQTRFIMPLFVSMAALLIGYPTTLIICIGQESDCGYAYLMFFLMIPFIFLIGQQFRDKVRSQRTLKKFILYQIIAILIFAVGYIIYGKLFY